MQTDAKELIAARIALAQAINEQRATETRAEADARREKMRRALAGPKKRFGRP